MPRIGLEERKILVGESSNVVRQIAVTNPKIGIGEMVQSGVQRPASK